jgi:hypothetical protein
MRFFLEAARDSATERAKDTINDTIDKAVLSYCKANKKKDLDVLKGDDWFNEKIKKTIKENAKELGFVNSK